MASGGAQRSVGRPRRRVGTLRRPGRRMSEPPARPHVIAEYELTAMDREAEPPSQDPHILLRARGDLGVLGVQRRTAATVSAGERKPGACQELAAPPASFSLPQVRKALDFARARLCGREPGRDGARLNSCGSRAWWVQGLGLEDQ